MPHGITPRQYKKLINRAKRVKVAQGEVIVRRGDHTESIHLVVAGRTRANVLGRRVTAASRRPGAKEEMKGGDSGAWIGEMAFLDGFGHRHEGKGSYDSSDAQYYYAIKSSNIFETSNGNVLWTVVAEEDCVLLSWSHEDMEKLLNASSDMRAAMTRAMTAAIVGKVVNFTFSKLHGYENVGHWKWLTWVKDWKKSGGAEIKVLDGKG